MADVQQMMWSQEMLNISPISEYECAWAYGEEDEE